MRPNDQLAPSAAHDDASCCYCEWKFSSHIQHMKYSQLRRGLSPEEAAAYVGSKELLRQFERAKWLRPFVRGNRLTRFDIRDLDGCIDRLKAGELLADAKAA
jgi:hypothetical protein